MTNNLPVAFDAMVTDITVTMDDVVSAYVATYEVNLFARKKELQSEIKLAEAGLKAVTKSVLRVVTGTEWNKAISAFDLVAKVDGTTVNWADEEDENKNRVTFSIDIRRKNDQSTGSYYRSNLVVTKYKPVPSKFVGERKALLKALSPARLELAEVLNNIKSIARKERAVRGKIAMRKLESSGYAPLLDDPELKALVQLNG